MAKLESRIRELEIELGSVQSKTGENMKAHQRSERKIKELQFQNDEDRKNQDRMSDLASKLQQKIGSSSSRTTRTGRTRTACPTWPPSSSRRSELTRSRSRRPRRSPPSTWPSSARPSRSWRRPRTEPGWPRMLFTPLKKILKNYKKKYYFSQFNPLTFPQNKFS